MFELRTAEAQAIVYILSSRRRRKSSKRIALGRVCYPLGRLLLKRQVSLFRRLVLKSVVVVVHEFVFFVLFLLFGLGGGGGIFLVGELL